MATKIVKAEGNNVSYTKSHTVTDITGVEFEVWGDTENYGQIRIDKEMEKAQQKKASADALDQVQLKKDKQDVAQAEIDILLGIQAEMDK